MHDLQTIFQDLVPVVSDGFGQVFEGRRAEVRWTIRLLPEGSKDVPAKLRSRLGQPVHPALLPVEVGATESGIYLAAPSPGRLLSQLLRESADGALLRPEQCVEVGLALAEAAAALAGAGESAAGQLAPLTWNNVYLDPQRPGRVWVLPLWAAPMRTADWLHRPPEDLAWVDRDLLRQAPSRRSDVVGIAALLQTLAAGRNTLPTDRLPTHEVITAAVHDEHPLPQGTAAVGPLEVLLHSALRRNVPELDDAAALFAALTALQKTLDPIVRAMSLEAQGQILQAQAVISRAAQQGTSSWALLLLKAHIEAASGHRARAGNTLRTLLQQVPTCIEALALLARLTEDPVERLHALNSAVSLHPFALQTRLDRARALRRAGKSEQAAPALLDVLRLAGMDPAQQRVAGLAAVEMAELLLAAGNLEAAAHFAGPCMVPAAEPDLRVEALYISGQAHYKAGVFSSAVQLLREAVQLDRTLRPGQPRVEMLNQLVFALVAVGLRVEARTLIEESLRLDPSQERLLHLLVALGETPPSSAPKAEVN